MYLRVFVKNQCVSCKILFQQFIFTLITFLVVTYVCLNVKVPKSEYTFHTQRYGSIKNCTPHGENQPHHDVGGGFKNTLYDCSPLDIEHIHIIKNTTL